MSLKVKVRQAADVTILDFSGRIVLGKETALMRDTLLDLIARGHRRFVLNLSDVPYIDSTGIGEMVNVSQTLRRGSGDVKLLNLTRRVRDMVEVVKLGSIFELFDDEAAAVDSFRGEPRPGLARAG